MTDGRLLPMTFLIRLPLLVLLVLVIGSDAAARTPSAERSAPQARAAVVGGGPAERGLLNSVVFITSQTGASSAMACSGTVIAPTVVLTAAHCVADEATGAARPAAGIAISSGRVTRGESGEDVGAARIVVHPGYDARAIRSDVALLVLSAPVSAAPVALAGGGDAALAAPGARGLFAGWGATAGNSSEASARLLRADTTVLENDACGRLLGSDFDAAVTLCAVDAPGFAVSTCRGDSGGPLLLARPDGSPVQVGITSWGSLGCDTRVPQAFARVSAFSGWIAGQLAAIASGPGGTSPSASAPAPAGAARPTEGAIAGAHTTGGGRSSAVAAALYRGRTAQRRAIAVRVAPGGRALASLRFTYRVRCELPRGARGAGATTRAAVPRWRGGTFRTLARTRVPLAARASGAAFTTAKLDSAGRRVRVTGAFAADGRLRGTVRVSWKARGGVRCDTGLVRYSARR